MSSLSGKTIVFTGTLSLPRNTMSKMATDAGAKVTGSVSGTTNIVVAGPGAGSKLDAAKSKGVTIWTEEEFVAATKGKASAASPASSKPAPKKQSAAAVKSATSSATPLAGKTIVFTGTLDQKRNDAQSKATAAGAKVTGSISGKTDLVVAGAQAGSKLDEAKAKGVKIITEDEFNAMCGGVDSGSSGSRKTQRAKADDEDDEDEDESPRKKPRAVAAAGSAKAKCLADAAFKGIAECNDNCHFPRNYYLSDLYFLRATEADGAVPDEIEERDDEQEIDEKQGQKRWTAMLSGMAQARSVDSTFSGDLIENQFFYFGYGQTVPFSFTIPPSLHDKKSWDINDVLVAAHYEDDDEEGSTVFESSDDGEPKFKIATAAAYISDVFKKHKEDDRKDDDPEKWKKGLKCIVEWKNKMEALPCFKQLEWGTGDNGNCDATTDVLYLKDMKAKVCSGLLILKDW